MDGHICVIFLGAIDGGSLWATVALRLPQSTSMPQEGTLPNGLGRRSQASLWRGWHMGDRVGGILLNAIYQEERGTGDLLHVLHRTQRPPRLSLCRRREDTWLIPLLKTKTFCFGLHSSQEWHLPEQQHSRNNEWGSEVSNFAPAWPVSQHCSPRVAKIMSQLPLPPQQPARVPSGHVFKLSSANRRDGNFSCRNESWGLCSVSSFQAGTRIPALRSWNAG